MKLRNRYTKTRSKRFMSIFILVSSLVVAAISATLPDIPDNLEELATSPSAIGRLQEKRQAAHERAVREGR